MPVFGCLLVVDFGRLVFCLDIALTFGWGFDIVSVSEWFRFKLSERGIYDRCNVGIYEGVERCL